MELAVEHLVRTTNSEPAMVKQNIHLQIQLIFLANHIAAVVAVVATAAPMTTTLAAVTVVPMAVTVGHTIPMSLALRAVALMAVVPVDAVPLSAQDLPQHIMVLVVVEEDVTIMSRSTVFQTQMAAQATKALSISASLLDRHLKGGKQQ